MRERLAIIDGVRTPLCKAGGQLRSIQADDLGVVPVRELLARSPLKPEDIDECIMGCVAQPAHAANVARIIAMKAGLPESCIAATVHRNCASGMESLSSAYERIMCGSIERAIVGGAESMSNIPLYYGPEMTGWFERMFKAKSLLKKLGLLFALRPRFLKPIIGIQLGLTDPYCGMNMGQTAEQLSREFSIGRAAQDACALESHQRASAAQTEGRLGEEIVPVPVPPAYEQLIEADDGIRHQQTLEALAKLKPYFDRDNGTVTVGNACPVTDGAAAMIVMKESEAQARALPVLGYLRSYCYAGLDPRRMGLGPVYATARLCSEFGYALSDFELIELNEAFAAQVLACEEAFNSAAFAEKHLNRGTALGELRRDILNVNGGAIALGHPVGTTGARLIITLLKEMQRRQLGLGLATLCVGGGQGAAFALERA